MNALPVLEFLPPAILAVIALALAARLHRAVLLDLGLLQRRRLFEGLSLLGLLVALLIAVTTLLLWGDNPGFVILVNVAWIIACGVLLLILRHRRRVEDDDVPLEIPGLDHDGLGTVSATPSSAARRVPLPAQPARQRLRANLAVYRRSAPQDDPSAPSTVERPTGLSPRASVRQMDKALARRARS